MRVRTLVRSLSLAAISLVSVASLARAQGTGAISVNFVGTGSSMATTEVAGVVAKPNWNNAIGASRSTPQTLLDETGAITTATLTWSANGTNRTGFNNTAGDYRMMRGYLDNSRQGATTVILSGLPNASYDVYVYADGSNGSATRSGVYQISGVGVTTQTTTLTDAANANFRGAFVQATNGPGNYVKFSVTAAGFKITATPGTASDSIRRAPVNGLQIVPIGPPSPDFAVASSPASQPVVAGDSTSYVLSVTALNGFTGPVSFSATGLPSGVTAAFNPSTVADAGSTTVTVTTSTSTPAATSTLTFTATSGALTHSATASLVVSAPPPPPDFTIALTPSSQSTTPGGTVAYTVTVGSVGGFSGTVSLAVGGLPSASSASFAPTSITSSGSTVMTVTTGASTPTGSSTLIVSGTSGTLLHSASAGLTVNPTVTQGTISLNFVGSGTAMAPTESAGVVPALNWNNATGNSRTTPLALLDASGVATTASVTYSGTSLWELPISDTAGNMRMMRGYLDVKDANTGTVTVSGLAANTYDVYVYTDGDNRSATRSASYRISGTGITTATISATDPPSTNFSGTFAQANNGNGNYVKYRITATGFTLTATPGTANDNYKRAPINGLQIVPAAPPAADFTIAISPASQTVNPGSATSYQVAIGALNGFSGDVALSTAGLPTGVSVSFNPATVTGAGTSTATVTTTASTTTGTPTLTFTGTSGPLAHSATASLTVVSNQLYSISGAVTPAALAAGTTVTLGGAATGSSSPDANGNFSFTSLKTGTYQLTPAKAGYWFNPANAVVQLSSADATGVNFTAAQTHGISGTIGNLGGAVVTLTLTGGASSATTSTDGNGQYTFGGLPDGSYTVTPSSSVYTFTPVSQTVSVSGADVAGVDFTAALPSNVLFFDDFNGTQVDTTKWLLMNRPGDSTNQEVQYYLPSNATVANGNLSIVTKVDSSQAGYNYTSAMMIWPTFNFTYGTVEIRAKLPGGTGPWPTFWLLGANCQASAPSGQENVLPCNWPQPGSDEIDMTEILASNLTSVNQQIHSGTNNPGCRPTVSDVSQNWHVYTLIWGAGSAVWKIDGVTTCSITSGVPNTPMFMIVNTALGGSGGGTVVNSTLPQTMTVDYIKVSK